MPQIWAGIDAGKGHHHCVVIDADGTKLHSAGVANDETALLELIATVTDLASGDECLWAIDLSSGGAALILGLLAAHDLPVVYIPATPCTTRRRRTGVMEKPTRRTQQSSPTRRACAATYRY